MPRKKIASTPSSFAALFTQAEQRIEAIGRQRIDEVRKLFEAVLARTGIALSDVFPRLSAAKPAATKTPAAPASSAEVAPAVAKKGSYKRVVKFRDPANADNTWTGSGSKPKWLSAAIASGATMESFAVGGGKSKKKPGVKAAKASKPAKPAQGKEPAKPAKAGKAVKAAKAASKAKPAKAVKQDAPKAKPAPAKKTRGGKQAKATKAATGAAAAEG